MENVAASNIVATQAPSTSTEVTVIPKTQVLVEETQQAFNPNLDLPIDEWLHWIMFVCGRKPRNDNNIQSVVPETQPSQMLTKQQEPATPVSK